jgi:phosphate-selective porin OprO/OprP
MIHGKISDGVFEYQLGIFNGVPDGASSDFDLNAAKDFAGRVFAHPFKSTSVEAAQGLGIGISGSVGTQSGSATNPNLPSYKTAGQNTFFSYLNDGTPEGTSIANGNRFRVSPQGYYYYRGFGLLGEYVLSSQNVALGPDSAQVQNTSWQIASSYVIGADNSYGAIKPRKPLGWKKGGTGAFEFAARYEELSVDPDAFPIFADPNRAARKARAWAGGFNWIINENIKFMLNFEQTRFDGGAANGGNRPTENAILNRYQINF